MPRQYTPISEHPAQNERFGIHGIFEREKRAANISEMGEHKICVPKPRVLVQGILRRYRGEEHKSYKNIYSRTVEER